METETIILPGKRTDAPWEGCLNSVNYLIPRGVPVKVPKALAELIRAGETEKRISAAALARFTKNDGARL
jgi:hypothetical protein